MRLKLHCGLLFFICVFQKICQSHFSETLRFSFFKRLLRFFVKKINFLISSNWQYIWCLLTWIFCKFSFFWTFLCFSLSIIINFFIKKFLLTQNIILLHTCSVTSFHYCLIKVFCFVRFAYMNESQFVAEIVFRSVEQTIYREWIAASNGS